MSDITLQELQDYADANGMTGAIDAANATIDLSALTGDAMDATSGPAEAVFKLLQAANATSVANDRGTDTYGNPSQSTLPAVPPSGTTPAIPPRVRITATFTGETPINFNNITASE